MRERFDQRTILFLALFVGLTIFNRMSSSGNIIDWLMEELYLLPGIVIALSFHEFGHAWLANKLGDPTAKNLGRVTINPAAHLDPIGFVALFIAGFGWGVPVPVNPNNFKHPKRDSILVSLAGVTLNLCLAIVFTVVLKLWVSAFGYQVSGMAYVVQTIILDVVMINIVLLVFNLLPVPPLDGFMVVTDLFDLQKYNWWYVVYQNGFLILLFLILFNVTDMVMTPMISGILNILLGFVW